MLIGLSHDADSIKKPFRHIWRVRKRFTRRQLLAHALGLKNLYDNFSDIMALEESLGVRSTFFIPVVLFDLSEIEDTLKELVRGGWEIGLHFVVEPYQRAALVEMERDWLEQLVGTRLLGVRTHNLAIDEGLMAIYARRGFLYDSSYRMEEVGRSTPYEHEAGLVEVPIGVMDADLFGRLRLSEEKAVRYVEHKMTRAAERGERAFAVLFHQESFSMRGGRIYKRLLERWAGEGNAYKLIDVLAKLGLGRIAEENPRYGRWRGGRGELHQSPQDRRGLLHRRPRPR